MQNIHKYTDNSAAKFRCDIPEEIILNKGWKVSVASYWFIKSWFSINDGENIFYVTVRDSKKQEDETITFKYTLQPGYYDTVTDIVDAVNELTEGIGIGEDNYGMVQLHYLEKQQRVRIDFDLEIVHVQFTDVLARALGFEPNTQITQSGTIGTYFCIIDYNRNVITLQCDLAANSLIGTQTIPAVRVIHTGHYLSGSPIFGDNLERVYVDLRKDRFKTISFEFRDFYNKPIPFTDSVCYVTLEFIKV